MWQCRNDEHVNSDLLVECEICGGKRPQILHLHTDQDIDIAKPLSIYWRVEYASAVKFQRFDDIVDVAPVGSLVISDFSDNDKIVLFAENELAVVSAEIQITLPCPQILYFKTGKINAVAGSKISVEWKVKNALNIQIFGQDELLGLEGTGLLDVPESGILTLVASNRTGEDRSDLHLALIPNSDISFQTKSKAIQYGSSTELIWNVKHASLVQLKTGGVFENIPHDGSLLISPSSSQDYTIRATALDLETVDERIVEVEVIQPIIIRQFKSLESYLTTGQSTYLTWRVDNATDLTILPEDVSVTGLDKLKVSPKQTTIYTLTAKNALHSVSKAYKVDVGHATTPVWKPLSGLLVVIILLLAGWFYSGYHKRKLAVAEVHRLLVQGQETAFTKCSIAETAFRQAFKLNLSLPPEYRSDSIAILSEHYNAEGDRRCHAYGRRRQDISYIIDCNYKLAAALRGSTEPKTCK